MNLWIPNTGVNASGLLSVYLLPTLRTLTSKTPELKYICDDKKEVA